MLRSISGIYVADIIVVLLLLLFHRPETDIGAAVVSAFVWPYTVVRIIRAS